MNFLKRQNQSLRQQFVLRLFIVLIVTALITSLVQLYFLKEEITREAEAQAAMVAQSINTGIEQTIIASARIEGQIDLKLISYARHVADLLGDRSLEVLDNEELITVRDQLGLGGITLLARSEEDIVGVLSTDPQDIGFSLKAIGFLEAGEAILDGGMAFVPGATLIDNGILVLPIAQSITNEQPTFYKYSYYHPPGKPYFISVFIEASEVYDFTEEIGTDKWISKMLEENSNIKEVGVLTPKVFEDPTLEEQLYPPMKRIVHGTFRYESEEDIEALIQMAEQPKQVSFIQKINDKSYYKMFMPINNDQVVYIALDYDQLSAPLYRHSVILIVSGLISLIALFILTASFFNHIYRDIQHINTQVKLLEVGDFTAQSEIPHGKGELTNLSTSANRMVHTLNQVLKDTSDQATKVQRLARLLEAEASQSVEKVYTISMETTVDARDEVEEINDFLVQVEKHLLSLDRNETINALLNRMETIRTIAKDRSVSTTEITLTLADLLKSLHSQSSELSDISKVLLQKMSQFKLEDK